MRSNRFRYPQGQSYLRVAAGRAVMNKLVREMQAFANANPFHPGVDDILQYRRDVTFDGHDVQVIFTRTVLPSGKAFYQLSIGNEEGMPADIPKELTERLRQAFVPNSVMIPSMLNNSFQYLEPV